MRVGYVRVSTVEQSEERQIIELRDKAGVEKFFVDKVSAKSAKRPKFDEMMNFLREGDRIYFIDGINEIQETENNINIKKKRTRDKANRTLSRFKENGLIQGHKFHKKTFGKASTFYSVEILI